MAESNSDQNSTTAPESIEKASVASSQVSVKNPVANDLMDVSIDQLSKEYGPYTIKEKLTSGMSETITFEALPNYIFFTDTKDLSNPPDRIALISVDEKDKELFKLTEDIYLGMTLNEIQQKFGDAVSLVPYPDITNEYVMDISGYKLNLYFDSASKLLQGIFDNDTLRVKERTSGFVITDHTAIYTAMHKQQGLDDQTAALYGKIDAMNEWKLLYYSDYGQWTVAGSQNFYKYHSDLGTSIWDDFDVLLKHFNVKVSDQFTMDSKYSLTPLPKSLD